MRLLWNHVGIAALLLAAATAARLALDPFLGSHLPYVTYFVAVVFIAWRTSTPISIASTVVGWLVVDYLFIATRFDLALGTVSDWVGSIAYFIVAFTIVFIAHRMREARVALERNERQLQVISQRLPALVSYISSAGRYVWCNDEYLRWFELEREQIVGKPVEEVLGAVAWRTVGPRIGEALAGSFVEYEAEVPYARGGTRWIHVTYTPHSATDGTVLGIVAMVVDISDRKQTELKATLLAQLGDAFARHPSVHEAARDVSERLVQRLGLSRCLLGEVDPATDTVRIFHQQSHDPEPSQEGDYRISDFLSETERRQLDDGRPLVINDVSEGRDPGAAARFLSLGIGAVVSAPYVAEGSRRFALAAEKREPYAWKPDEVELLHEVAARVYVQLDRSRADQALRESERRYRSLARDLVEADRRKDEFLATLAHELRNPLAPIRNGLYILKLTAKADGTVADIYQMLERQVNHLIRLVDDLMEVSRITRGRVELRKERTDVRSVVESAIETSRPLIDATGHRLEVDLPAEPLSLDADPMRLAQAITNLLNNAAKFTDAGGRIRIGARREAGSVAISVCDNGAGIAQDLLPRVFDLFAQGSGQRHGKGGLGIGLTLVRSMVELHGGTVEARSEGERRGSEFIIRLPLGRGGIVPASPSEASAPGTRSRRVLVVDDNHDAAKSLGVLLALLGVETRTAHDGPAAIAALDEFQPTAILLDTGMPKMEGDEIAQRVRQHSCGRHVMLVALTGFGHERDRRGAADGRFDHHLTKPLDLEMLRQLLDRLPSTAGHARRA